MERQCDKAASTLTSFVDNGKMPVEVLAKCKGIAIFSAFRAGMWFSGQAGSGVVLAKRNDGSWSPPCSFSIKSGGVGLVYGIDYFDCVCVLNPDDAVAAYTSSELDIGSRLEASAGPVGGKFDYGDAPAVWTYTRSRGVYGGITLDGTKITEASKVNKEFYGQAVSAAKILEGGVDVQEGKARWPAGAAKLMAALSTAESRVR